MISTFVFLTISGFVFVGSIPFKDDAVPRESVQGIGFSSHVQYVNLSLVTKELQQNADQLQRNENNVYLLYTRRNPSFGQQLIIYDAASIFGSHFRPGQPVVVIAHGWLGSYSSDLNTLIRNAFLMNIDSNVIVLDWSHIAQRDYISAMSGIPEVGQALGQFMLYLSKNFGVRLEEVHLTGFSLGAHVVGNAGRFLDGKVGRITGMDPGGPLMNISPRGLKPTDGIYVEAIITNGAKTDMSNNVTLGKVTFYANDGENQPGCFTSFCNHNRSWHLFAATVTLNHLVGHECFSDEQVLNNQCDGKTFNMGNGILGKTGSGRFRVNTDKSYPYS